MACSLQDVCGPRANHAFCSVERRQRPESFPRLVDPSRDVVRTRPSNTPGSLIPPKLATTQTSSIVDDDVIAPEAASVDRFAAARTYAVHRRCALDTTNAAPSAQQALLIAAGVLGSPAHHVQLVTFPAPARPEHQKLAAAVMV